MKSYKILLTIFIMLIIVMPSCGKADNDEKNEEKQNDIWILEQLTLPDANDALGNEVLDNTDYSLDLMCDIFGTNVYIVKQVHGINGGESGVWIQIISEPYTSWQNIFLSSNEWMENVYLTGVDACLDTSGNVNIKLETMNNDDELEYYRAVWKPGEEPEICKLSYDELENGFNDSICYDVVDGTEVTIKTKDENINLTSENIITDAFGEVVFMNENAGYICTTDGIFEFDKTAKVLEAKFSFVDNGFVIEKVEGVSVDSEGEIIVLAKTDDGYVLISRKGVLNVNDRTQNSEVSNTDKFTEKKIGLSLASAYPSAYLKEVIADFNKENDKYFIVLRNPENGQAVEDFKTVIQMELGTGKGPDLLTNDVFNLQDAVDNGGVVSLTEMGILTETNLIDSVVNLGIVNDNLYAVPFSFTINTFVTAGINTEKKEYWTSSDLMSAVEKSGAKVAVSNLDSVSLATMLLENSGLIDWENKTCNFNDELAIRILEFSKKYGDHNTSQPMGSRIVDGEVCVYYVNIAGMLFVQGYEAMFDGDEVYIGLPTTGTSGNILIGDTLSINQASGYIEGAFEFIKYLVSSNCQDKLAADSIGHGVSGFPTNKSSLDKVFEDYYDSFTDDEYKTASIEGFNYEERPLSENSFNKFKLMIENAIPETDSINIVEDIIEDEVNACFSQNVDTQATCEHLQSRVKLYFEESR